MVARRSGILVFAVALLASLAVHVPVYEVLGALRDKLFAEDEQRRQAQPVEFEFITDEAPPEPTPDTLVEKDALAQTEPSTEPLIDPDIARPSDRAPKPKQPKREPDPQREPEPDLPEPPSVDLRPPAPPPPPPPVAPPPPQTNQQAVVQQSPDPNVEPPPDAQYIAEHNSRVEEESAADVTALSAQEAAVETHVNAAPPTPDEARGDSEDEVMADERDAEGDTSRVATATETQLEREQPSEASAGEILATGNQDSRRPAAGEAAAQQAGQQSGTAQSPGASATEQAALERRTAAAPDLGGAPSEPETITIDDGFGTITVRRPSQVGRGDGAQAGVQRQGVGGVDQRMRRGAAGRAGGSPLNLSWSQFEQAFGSDELREQREAYAAEQRSKNRGGSRDGEWRAFRAAIENHLHTVRPGNQTALNAAASPFATYLVQMHNRIHREFAHKYIPSIMFAAGPLADTTLNSTLEIVLNRDGSIHRIAFVRQSGVLLFDLGAFNAVMRSQPFPEPPHSILSGDSRVYVHWGFYRNERQCGTFNAQPFILPNPDGAPTTPAPLRDTDPPPPAAPGIPREPLNVPADGTYGFNTYH